MENPASSDKLTRSQVLGLDLATITGYYSAHGHGSWNFRPGKERNGNKPYFAFYTTLKTFIRQHGIRKIVTEDINFSAHNSDYRKLNELRGIILLLVEELGLLPVEFVNVRTLKRWATGDGNADKRMMMAACVNHYRFHPQTSDEADACHLYYYFLRKFRIV